ncbi:MAG TPA: Lar family restriction alleviation protein [Burkholderiales bacterium]|nr:Lar family restriction alleviation protein [Burkholderiales bacterium]
MNTTSGHGELLPCPCCGGEALFGRVTNPDDVDFNAEFVYCAACDLATALMWPLKGDVKRELAERWNKRTAADPKESA